MFCQSADSTADTGSAGRLKHLPPAVPRQGAKPALCASSPLQGQLGIGSACILCPAGTYKAGAGPAACVPVASRACIVEGLDLCFRGFLEPQFVGGHEMGWRH